jgi:protoheme IX farnesyltransferase
MSSVSSAKASSVRTLPDWTAFLMGRLTDYRQMSRPRIVVMSAAAIAAGFILGSPISVSTPTLAHAIFGICCLVAASSVLNQVIESESDANMNRTQSRPVSSGRMSRLEAASYGILLSVTGTMVLAQFINALTAGSSLLTMLTYVLLYTPLKSRSALCTTVGAVPGAMPAVLGWFAAGQEPGLEALALFAIFFVWQFPHFLAIGWIYRDQYQAAGLKMLPSFTDGGRRAGWVALIYAIGFVPVSCMPRFVGLAGTGYLGAAAILSLGYLWLTSRFFVERSNQRARQLMVGSLICLPVLLICLVADYLRLTS